jgi:hypothetical protein
VNPGLTIAAQALRVADHIRETAWNAELSMPHAEFSMQNSDGKAQRAYGGMRSLERG